MPKSPMLESLERLAEAQIRVRKDPPRMVSMTWEQGIGIAVPTPDGMDFPALQKYVAWLEEVAAAAKELSGADFYVDGEKLTADELTHVYKLQNNLDAAIAKEPKS